MTDNFYATHYVWQVYFEVHGPLAEVTLTFRRALPNGRSVEFDVDPDTIFDIDGEIEYALLMDGVLALLPDDELLSCALRWSRDYVLFDHNTYEIVFASYDKQRVRSVFQERLWNTDGHNPDFVFAGGERAAHEPATLKHWARMIKRDMLPVDATTQLALWEQLLNIYQHVVYADSTEVHLVTHNESGVLERARAALQDVAARYGLALPPEPERSHQT